MTRRSSGFFISFALALISLPATAIEVQSSVSVSLGFQDCQPSVPPCDLAITAFRFISGEPGDLAAFAEETIEGYGSAFIEASLSGEIGAPVLRTSAISTPGKRVTANAVALQRFEYLGSEPAIRNFGGTLTYQQSVVNEGNLGPVASSGVNASISIFVIDESAIEAGTNATDNFNALFSISFGFLPGYRLIGVDGIRDNESNDSGQADLSVSVTLNPGDVVWVRTLLQTPATEGSTVDASRTLITRWDDPTDLIPANISPGVPETLLARLLESATGVGPGTSLADKVAIAQAYYAAQDVESACATLDDFQKQVNAVAGRRLSRELANQLSSDAQQTQLAIGCF